MRILFISCLLWTILFTRQVKGEFILPSVASEFWDKILYYTQTSWKLFSMTHIHIALKVVLPKLQQTHFAFVQKRIIDSRIVQILSVIIRRSAISSWLQFNAIWFLNWNCILILSIRWANGKDKAIDLAKSPEGNFGVFTDDSWTKLWCGFHTQEVFPLWAKVEVTLSNRASILQTNTLSLAREGSCKQNRAVPPEYRKQQTS